MLKIIIIWYQGGETMTDKVEVKLRLPQETKNRLQLAAEKEKRSMNNLLEFIIDKYLNKESE